MYGRQTGSWEETFANFQLARDSDGMPICKAKLYCRTTDERQGFFSFTVIPLRKKAESFRTKSVALSVTRVSVSEIE
jgi:hypothetical protein